LRSKFNILFILICLFTLNFKIFPQTEKKYQLSSSSELQSAIKNITSDPFFEQTIIAIDVFDLTDSISLFEKNEKLLLRPASNMKILTSIAGLLNLGPDYQFKTELYHSGIIEGETLYGNLYVVGGFDPDFTMDNIDSLVSVIQSLGINEINGGIFADISKKDSLYWGKGWMWDDDPDPTSPYLSTLNINDNSIEVFVEGDKVGSSAKVSLIPQTKFVKIINKTITVSPGSADNFKITRDWLNRSNTILVDGEVRKVSVVDSSANTEKINLLYPEKYFLTLFKEHLEKEGIKVNGDIDVKNVKENSVYLTSIQRNIDTVLSDLNKESDNLNAEMIVYAIAFKDSGAPAIAENGLEATRRLIDSLGFNDDYYFIADGSGASHYNLVSAELLLEVLKYLYYDQKELFDLFYNSLAHYS